MAKKALRKDLRMEIRKNRGRFISIFMIVALGVAFFSGLRSAENDMRYTADYFADTQRMMDLRLISTMGLTDDDVNALAEIPGVLEIEASNLKYLLTTRGDTDYVLEVTAIPQRLNTVQLTEGRMPDRADECLADRRLKKSGFEIGDEVTVRSGTDEDLEESMTQCRFTIVGFGDVPLYIGLERGSATIGNGQISGFLMVEPEVFDQDYYTQIYLTIDGAEDQISFTDEYSDTVASVRSAVEAIEKERCQARYEEVCKEYREPLEEADQEYQEKEEEVRQELADAREELDSGWEELEEGKQTCLDSESELEDTRKDLESKQEELLTTRSDLESKQEELLTTKQDLESRQSELLSTKSDLQAKQNELTATKGSLESKRAELVTTKGELESKQAELLSTKNSLEGQRQQLLLTISDLESKQAELLSAKSELEEQQADLLAQKDSLLAKRDGLSEQKEELLVQKDELLTQKNSLEEQQDELLEKKSGLEATKTELEAKKEEVLNQQNELLAQQSQLIEAKNGLETQKASLQAMQSELNTKKEQTEAAKAGLLEQQSQLLAAKAALEQQAAALAQQRAELEARRIELEALAAAGTPDAEAEAQLAADDAVLTAAEQQNREQSEAAAAGLAETEAGLMAAEEALAQIETGLAETEAGLVQVQGALDEVNANLSLVEAGLAETADGLIQIEDALLQVNDGLLQVNDGLSQIEDGLVQIEDGLAQIEDGLVQIEDGLVQIEDGLVQIEDGLVQIEDVLLQVNDGLAQVEDGLVQANDGLARLDAGLAQVNDGLAQVNSGLAQVNDGLGQLDAALVQVNSGLSQVNDGLVQVEDGLVQIRDGLRQVNDGETELNDGLAQVEDGLSQIEDGLVQVEDGFEELEDAKAEIEENEALLLEKEEEYSTAKEDAEQQLADAREELDDGWAKLEELEMPEWYLTDRDDLPGYFDYGSNAERIGAIGKVFPAIFFLVAALVALTAITRMVEEQRTQIGTYKALGYSKADVTFKYLAYAMLATVGGGIAGVLIGEKLFPFVIIICYRIMYTPLLHIVIPYNLKYSLISIGIAVASTATATMFACYKELAAQPAVLMRPVAPKAGKRVFLERIGILWRHLSFSQKATFRNLFRYKKRLVMTVFGIGCCCGLMVVGFGLKDSIMNIASIQYDNIQLYDAMVSIEENISEEAQEALDEAFAADDRLVSSAELMMKSMDASTAQAVRTAYVIVVKDTHALDTMMTFRSRNGHETYEMDDKGVIVSEQLAGALGVGAGDSFTLQLGNSRVQTEISHVSENYLMHYIYMTEPVYKELFGEKPDYNMYWLDLTEEGKAQEEAIGRSLIGMDGVLTVTYVSATRDMIENMLNSLYLIVIVLVIAASLLAFVVIYNLNNINISERRRELATLKLLGFYDIEVANYVYRENIYLTIIGAFAGLGIGKLLHGFVINTIEVNQIMFGREVTVPSYLYCMILTFVFSAVVNMVMYFQLKKIDMVESLKSVE